MKKTLESGFVKNEKIDFTRIKQLIIIKNKKYIIKQNFQKFKKNQQKLKNYKFGKKLKILNKKS